MPFWSDETWRGLTDADAPVEPFDRNHLEEAKYVMAVGEEVYLSSNAPGSTTKRLVEHESFPIGPGQFAYILTHERVRIPVDAIGFISINASVKFSGLVNISGFHVDPGYRGRIIFSVFNAGPSPIHLTRGERIFPLWIASLDWPTRKAVPKFGYDRIPARLVTNVSGNYTTAFELNDTVRKLREDHDKTRQDVETLKALRLQILVFVGSAYSRIKLTQSVTKALAGRCKKRIMDAADTRSW